MEKALSTTQHSGRNSPVCLGRLGTWAALAALVVTIGCSAGGGGTTPTSKPSGAAPVASSPVPAAPTTGARPTAAGVIAAPTNPPLAAVPPPAPPSQSNDQEGCSQWNVSGRWETQQSNGFTPMFVLNQSGPSVSGTASLDLPGADPPEATATVSGTVSGDQLRLAAEWSFGSRGEYRATIVSGSLQNGVAVDPANPDGPRIDWFAVGPTRCAS